MFLTLLLFLLFYHHTDQFCHTGESTREDPIDKMVCSNVRQGILILIFACFVINQSDSVVSHFLIHDRLQEKTRAVRELTATVLARPPKMCNFIEWQDKKVVYKRYASLYFVACVDKEDNELIILEQIHLFVEVLDRYFGNVCELDIIFNFHKAYYILDELFIGGHLQETSKAEVLRITSAMDEMMDEAKDEGTTPGRSNAGRPNGR